MTIKDVTRQVFDLCDGHLNGTILTQQEFKEECKIAKTGKVAWFGITLPDGHWLMRVTWSKKWGWEYEIPTTEEGQYVFEELYKEEYAGCET